MITAPTCTKCGRFKDCTVVDMSKGGTYDPWHCPNCEPEPPELEVTTCQGHTLRGQVLLDALTLTEGDRNKTYGHPHANLSTFAGLVESYLKAAGWTGPAMDSVDGSVIMLLAKVSRVAGNKHHRDNYVDGAAYMAIAAECSDLQIIGT